MISFVSELGLLRDSPSFLSHGLVTLSWRQMLSGSHALGHSVPAAHAAGDGILLPFRIPTSQNQ